ncbi:hypothetical protein GJW-30_1_02478 [Variibacter gotjawalensis]|uniref:Nickel uptake substrate-specific transmembrane region n=1 Tax=Variibacter gotjawalensis TaxID=1333996 RepID=A0A0S3PVH3_9BRAD|nr:DUF1007 family protein [Variibacter gotjawalensis]NIK45766.1 ABC-type uncharacterized transport system substrate-binding protein [Variibacter gotjawalensis]RZS47690.1 ABC-type uncharacterized transport system substrate-binding protein [Variibacter gotjawalensis]BAT59943.1 hypothetical protein GJW-30_1_02478 [Variibacter gotjawalensis]
MFINALRAAVALCLALGAATAAHAHPHVWVKATSEVVYAPDGSATAIKHHWTFDEMFSTFATQGMDTKKGLTREELAPLAEVNVTSLKDFDFFTAATADGKKATFKAPIDYYLDWKDSALTLHFTLPFEQAQKAKALELEMYDQTFFVDFSFADGNPVSLVGAPQNCKLSRPPPKDASGKFTETPFQTPPDGVQGASFINRVMVTCP